MARDLRGGGTGAARDRVGPGASTSRSTSCARPPRSAWAASTCARTHGGSGLTRLDAALIFEALATGCPTVAAYISIHNMVAWMIDTLRRRRAARALAAAAVHRWSCSASYCLTEPAPARTRRRSSTRAVRDGDDYVLNGVKQFISGAGVGGLYVVMARTGERRARAASRRSSCPRTRRDSRFGANEHKMGWNAQPTRPVIFDDARVPVANRLGDEGEGFRSRWPGSTAAASTSPPARSAARRRRSTRRVAYLARAPARSARRWRRSRPCSSASPTWRPSSRPRGLLAVARRGGARRQATRRRRSSARWPSASRTDAGFDVANGALQLHGGYGYLAEYGIEKIVRDLRVHQILEGTNEIMRVIIARAVVGAADDHIRGQRRSSPTGRTGSATSRSTARRRSTR